jgi:hypothetical protein
MLAPRWTWVAGLLPTLALLDTPITDWGCFRAGSRLSASPKQALLQIADSRIALSDNDLQGFLALNRAGMLNLEEVPFGAKDYAGPAERLLFAERNAFQHPALGDRDFRAHLMAESVELIERHGQVISGPPAVASGILLALISGEGRSEYVHDEKYKPYGRQDLRPITTG